MKKIFICVVLSVMVFTAFILPANYASGQSEGVGNFSKEELLSLIKPGVVRVVQHTTGEMVIPAFDVDLNNLEIEFLPNESPLAVPVDQYLTGSGFAVSPDGHILTNSHVVSTVSLKLLAVSETLVRVILAKAAALTPEEDEALEARYKELGYDVNEPSSIMNLALKWAETLVPQVELAAKTELKVLKPSSLKEKFIDLVEDGYAAEVASVNDEFYRDEKDVALLKINAANVPSLELAAAGSVQSGQKVYILGFPATAQVNATDFLESTFTEGIIGSIKDSRQAAFKLLQTDAKVSEGSSGGPLVNEQGQVIGIVTYQSNQLSQGDNFASAIPIKLGAEILQAKAVTAATGEYRASLLAGFALLAEKHCKKAKEAFQQAGHTNFSFQTHTAVEGFKQKCDQMIASGESIDTFWQEAASALGRLGAGLWLAIALGSLVVVALAIVIHHLLKRMRSDEHEIAELQHHEFPAPPSAPVMPPQPVAMPPPPATTPQFPPPIPPV